MAGAIDLTLYGIAIFISPVAVYFKKGVGAQFWVNCCLYCLMGVPGIIHAFYIIHTSKDNKDAPQRPPQSHSQTTRQRSASLPSLPHSSRYRPQADFAPYEDHPPPIPPKAEEPPLPYDPALHPNSANSSIGRAKSVLHTYRIPQSTLRPAPPRRSRYSTPSPNPPDQRLDQTSEQPSDPQPQPQPETVPETRASSSTLHPDPNGAPSYPAEYHPNSAGANISVAKAILHTYQIPETTLPPRTEEDAPATEEPPKRSKSGSVKGSMWPLRSKGKGLSPLDVNSPTAVSKPDSAEHKSKWATTGPSWLRRRRGREDLQNGATGTDEEGPATMTMIWDDNFEALRPRDQNLKQAKTHARSESEPFPAPPGAVRPVIDRTGTSNAPLLQRRPRVRRDSTLEAVAENANIPEQTASEGEEYPQKPSPPQDQYAETDTELARSKSRLISRLGRRQQRPRLDTVMDAATPTSFTSAPVETESPRSPSLPRHIVPPAVLASSIEESRPTGLFRRVRTSSANSNSTPRSSQSFRNDIDFAMGEYGLGRSGDAYSAATRALRSRELSTSTSSSRALTSPMSGGKRLSVGTALSQATAFSQVPTSASASTPAMRLDWTQGTFGSGPTSESSEEGGDIRATSQRSKSESALPQTQEPETRSQDKEIDEWIKREDERREASASSGTPTPSASDPSEPSVHGVTPHPASIFSMESSGFAGIGVGTAHEKGRAGKMEVWDRPNWDGLNPSTGQLVTDSQPLPKQPEYAYASSTETHENPFKDPVPAPSTATHSSYATGQESFSPASAPISPPVSPNRPTHPARPPPAIPGAEQKSTKAVPVHTGTFGTASPETQAGPSSSGEKLSKPVVTKPFVQVPPATPPVSPPRVPVSSKSPKPPPVPTRPGAPMARPQSPKLPPKPVALRSMSSEDDDMSEIYARALRD
ncbi:hypothetical protein RSOLAG22IIIB_04786 [Rhizoctonia solani]|uniref:Uncharacterized protein n=1 Tax=Rhizoctonia solani TaxID=456999 RepID=A0A0K6G011_9AGAM|nr:hypothetical protein RSOLAG22IIIB_04786 [Rhizoctonia solani]